MFEELKPPTTSMRSTASLGSHCLATSSVTASCLSCTQPQPGLSIQVQLQVTAISFPSEAFQSAGHSTPADPRQHLSRHVLTALSQQEQLLPALGLSCSARQPQRHASSRLWLSRQEAGNFLAQ